MDLERIHTVGAVSAIFNHYHILFWREGEGERRREIERGEEGEKEGGWREGRREGRKREGRRREGGKEEGGKEEGGRESFW